MDASNVTTFSHLVDALSQRFRSLPRGPYGRVALKSAQQADEKSFERILADESTSAFQAYQIATTRRHYTGKANLERLLTDLKAQPIDVQRHFAKQLASAVEKEGSRGQRQGAKRRRMIPIS